MAMVLPLFLIASAVAYGQTQPAGLTVKMERKGMPLTPREAAVHGSTGVKSGTIAGASATFQNEDVNGDTPHLVLIDQYTDGSSKMYLVENADNVLPPPDDDDAIHRLRLGPIVLRRGGTLSVDVGQRSLTFTSADHIQTQVSETDPGTGIIVFSQELALLPAAREPWALLQQTPALLIDRINVGGNEAGQQARIVLQGGLPNVSLWGLDGVTISDMAALGSSPAYYDFDVFEEIRTRPYPMDPSQNPNFVWNSRSKAGTNAWRLSTGYSYGGGNDAAQAFRRNVVLGGSSHTHAQLGGPIVRDRAWFFGSTGRSSFDLTAQAADAPTDADVDLGQYVGRVTLRPLPNHLVDLSYLRFESDRLGSGASPSRAASSTNRLEESNSTFGIRYDGVIGDVILGLVGGRTTGTSHEIPNQATPVFKDVWQNSFGNLATDRPKTYAKSELAYLASTGPVSHEFKGGLETSRYELVGHAEWQGNGFTSFQPGVAFPVRVETPGTNWGYQVDQHSAYVSETLRTKNLTLDLGLRFERQSARNTLSSVDAHPTNPNVPGAVATGSDADVYSYDDVSPRLGFTYAVGKERNLLLRGSYSRFADQLGSASASFTNPTDGLPQNYAYAFAYSDSNGNFLPDPGEPRGAGVILGGRKATDPGAFDDPDRFTVTSIPGGTTMVLGADRTYASEYMVGMKLRWEKRGKGLNRVPLVSDGTSTRPATAEDFFGDRSIGGVDYEGNSFNLDARRLKPGLSQVGIQLQDGVQETEYLGTTLFFQKRFSNRWSFAANLSISDWPTPGADFADANDLIGSADNTAAPAAAQAGFNRRDVFMNSNWSLNLRGLYEIAPDRPWGFTVVGDVHGRQGFITPASYTLRGGDNVTRQIQIGDFERRLDDVWLTNLQVSKIIQIGATRVWLTGEVLNLLNNAPVLGQDRDAASSTHGATLEVMSPRVVRIGARLSFR